MTGDELVGGYEGAEAEHYLLNYLSECSLDEVMIHYGCKVYRYQRFSGSATVREICNVLPEIKKILNKGTELKPLYVYLFNVRSDSSQDVVEILFSAEELSSRKVFSAVLLSKIAGGFFVGNEDDFNRFVSHVLRVHSGSVG